MRKIIFTLIIFILMSVSVSAESWKPINEWSGTIYNQSTSGIPETPDDPPDIFWITPYLLTIMLLTCFAIVFYFSRALKIDKSFKL